MTITAEVICDSVSPSSVRITTMQLRYPRFIHAEFMTHRMFSRNASSSRAIPVKRLIQDVMEDPAVPIHWGMNQKGMQADEENRARVGSYSREEAWMMARQRAVDMALRFSEAGYHKQVVNRLIEPFAHINVVVTATEWSNFFKLRDHQDAQPEMRALAVAMKTAMAESTPHPATYGSWHLPYIDRVHDNHLLLSDCIKASVARCARVSYLTHSGLRPSIDDDLALYDRLVGATPPHASPAEHQAVPTIYSGFNANFRGWISHRSLMEEERL